MCTDRLRPSQSIPSNHPQIPPILIPNPGPILTKKAPRALVFTFGQGWQVGASPIIPTNWTNWTRRGTQYTQTRSSHPTLPLALRPHNAIEPETCIHQHLETHLVGIRAPKRHTVDHRRAYKGTPRRRRHQVWILSKIPIRAMAEVTLHQHHNIMVEGLLGLATPRAHILFPVEVSMRLLPSAAHPER